MFTSASPPTHPPAANNAEHFICVIYDGMSWKYDNDSAYYTFTPEPSDILVASLNFTSDTVTSLVGSNTSVSGIASGYASGNLTYTANLWNGLNNPGEFSVGGTSFTPNTLVTAKKYYYSGATRLAMRDNGTLRYLLGDHPSLRSGQASGSSNKAVDASGALLPSSETRFKAWGEQCFPSGASAMPTTFRFTGQRQEAGLGGADGLYFYNARWFDAALGRFIQADTIIPNPNNPIAFDRYAYVLNSPVNYTDPSGHTSPCGFPWSPPECKDKGGNNGSIPPKPSTPSGPALTGKGMAWGGLQLYKLYQWVWAEKSGWWWKVFGADGVFDIWDFVGLLLYYEGGNFLNGDFREGAIRAFYGWSSYIYKNLAGSAAAALNWLASMGTGMSRYFNILAGSSLESQFPMRYKTEQAVITADQFRDPPKDWQAGWAYNRPYFWGNFSMIKSEDVIQFLINNQEYLFVYAGSSIQGNQFSVPSGCVWKYWMSLEDLSIPCPIVR